MKRIGDVLDGAPKSKRSNPEEIHSQMFVDFTANATPEDVFSKWVNKMPESLVEELFLEEGSVQWLLGKLYGCPNSEFKKHENMLRERAETHRAEVREDGTLNTLLWCLFKAGNAMLSSAGKERDKNMFHLLCDVLLDAYEEFYCSKEALNSESLEGTYLKPNEKVCSMLILNGAKDLPARIVNVMFHAVLMDKKWVADKTAKKLVYMCAQFVGSLPRGEMGDFKESVAKDLYFVARGYTRKHSDPIPKIAAIVLTSLLSIPVFREMFCLKVPVWAEGNLRFCGNSVKAVNQMAFYCRENTPCDEFVFSALINCTTQNVKVDSILGILIEQMADKNQVALKNAKTILDREATNYSLDARTNNLGVMGVLFPLIENGTSFLAQEFMHLIKSTLPLPSVCLLLARLIKITGKWLDRPAFVGEICRAAPDITDITIELQDYINRVLQVCLLGILTNSPDFLRADGSVEEMKKATRMVIDVLNFERDILPLLEIFISKENTRKIGAAFVKQTLCLDQPHFMAMKELYGDIDNKALAAVCNADKPKYPLHVSDELVEAIIDFGLDFSMFSQDMIMSLLESVAKRAACCQASFPGMFAEASNICTTERAVELVGRATMFKPTESTIEPDYVSTELFWRAEVTIILLGCFGIKSLVQFIWDKLPIVRACITMMITKSASFLEAAFPGKTMADIQVMLEELDREEQELIAMKFGGMPIARGSIFPYIHKSKIRQAPESVIKDLCDLDNRLGLSARLIKCRDPNIFEMIIGENAANAFVSPWFRPMVQKNRETLASLSFEKLCKLFDAGVRICCGEGRKAENETMLMILRDYIQDRITEENATGVTKEHFSELFKGLESPDPAERELSKKSANIFFRKDFASDTRWVELAPPREFAKVAKDAVMFETSEEYLSRYLTIILKEDMVMSAVQDLLRERFIVGKKLVQRDDVSHAVYKAMTSLKTDEFRGEFFEVLALRHAFDDATRCLECKEVVDHYLQTGAKVNCPHIVYLLKCSDERVVDCAVRDMSDQQARECLAMIGLPNNINLKLNSKLVSPSL